MRAADQKVGRGVANLIGVGAGDGVAGGGGGCSNVLNHVAMWRDQGSLLLRKVSIQDQRGRPPWTSQLMTNRYTHS